MKCEACLQNICGRKYEQRNFCQGGKCLCVCKMPVIDEIKYTGGALIVGAIGLSK